MNHRNKTNPCESEGTAVAADAEAHRPTTLLARACRSFVASAGSIVFGMEDGTVSIFGLVFGVTAAAPDSRAVLLAGGTGAVACCRIDDGRHVLGGRVDERPVCCAGR